ncbi:MAG: CPBP family intramembrane glutamic endopeptidase [Candidatus Komeilibacteria bacterium]
MNRIYEWISHEVSFQEALKLTFKVTVLMLGYGIAIVLLFRHFGIVESRGVAMKINVIMLINVIVMEELFFRLPLSIITRYISTKGFIVLSFVLLSIFFGWMHGHWLFIFSQGVLGIALSLVYLKCGGFSKNLLTAVSSGRIFVGLLCAVLLHSSYNCAMFYFIQVTTN